jgi:spermidine synthase
MNSPYLILPIAILSLLLYSLGQFLVWWGTIDGTLLRKIWNVMLLTLFLATAVLGLLLAIQVNYKLEWIFVKAALKWHVDLGIGLSFVAVFHVLWHLNYYLNLLKIPIGKTVLPTVETIKTLETRKLKLLIFLSGFVATVIQVLMIREITTVFEGNEWMMGWILGGWMLLTGIGAFLGKQKRRPKNEEKLLSRSLFMLSILPIILLVLLNLLKNQLFPVGILVSPVQFLVLLVAVLSPICLISGFIYSLLIGLFQTNKNDFIQVYSFESIGSLIGGLVGSMLFIQWLSIFQTLFLISVFVLILLFYAWRKKVYLFTGIICLIVFLLSFILPFDTGLKSYLFTNQKVLEHAETFYGNIAVTESAGQYNFFGNGSLLFTTDNTMVNEENVHYAMLQTHHPENVLIVSGGIAGMVEEIFKYPSIKCIDYVEINPRLVEIASKYKPLPVDERLHFFAMDGRRFIKNCQKKYDVAIFAIPDPSSLQINRYYTHEFFEILKGKLTRNAVIILGLSPSGNYMSPVKAGIEASVYQTLKKHFAQVEILPGEKDYLLASDTAINVGIAGLSLRTGIVNNYVNPYYIDDYSIKQRGEQIKNSLEKTQQINTDNQPIPVFYETLHYLSQYHISGWLLFGIPLVLLTLPLFFMRAIPRAMYIAGFSGSSFEMLLLFSFQIMYGYVYSAIGLIIAVFMGGLAVGALLGYKINPTRNHLLVCQLGMAMYAVLLPLLWSIPVDEWREFPVLSVFGILTFIPSVLVGLQYVAGTHLLTDGTIKAAQTLYAADLIGSALSVAAVTLVLLPLFGLTKCCYIVAGFNGIGLAITYYGNRTILKQKL